MGSVDLFLKIDFLKSRKQRVVLDGLNGQHLSWGDALVGVPEGSILAPLFFLIYINDLSDGLQCNPKLLADDTSLFATVYNMNKTTDNLNNDINQKYKMGFLMENEL